MSMWLLDQKDDCWGLGRRLANPDRKMPSAVNMYLLVRVGYRWASNPEARFPTIHHAYRQVLLHYQWPISGF